MSNQVDIVCDLNAIPSDQREEHQVNGKDLFQRVTEVRELSDGYAFCLPAENFLDAAHFIANERLCCPFFEFTLKLEPQSSGLWLSLAGEGEVKAFVKAEIGGLLSEAATQRL